MYYRRACACGMVYNLKLSPPKKDELCDKCGKKLYRRADDTKEAIKERLKIYKKETKPVVKYYKKKRLLRKINGEKTIKVVFNEILSYL